MKQTPFLPQLLTVALLLVSLRLVAQADVKTDAKAPVEAYMQETRARIEKELKGLTAEQFRYKAASDKWSIAEVVEHIVLTENGMRSAAQGLLKSPANPEKRAEIKFTFAMMKVGVPDRGEGKRRQAPEQFVPKGIYTRVKEAAKAFTDNRKATETLLKTTPTKELEEHCMEFGPAGMQDALGILSFAAAHSQRHLGQIQEIKANASYPKGK